MRLTTKATITLTALAIAALGAASTASAGDDEWSWRRVAERMREVLAVYMPKGGTAYSGFPFAVPTTIALERFNNGGEGVAYHDDTTSNIGGQFRPSERVDIYSCTQVDCYPYHVGDIKPGEWMDYAITTSQPGVYRVDTALARSVSGTATYHLELDGTNVTGSLAVPLTGGNTTFNTVPGEPIYVSNGAHNLRLANDAGTWRADTMRFTRLAQQSHQTTPWPAGRVEAERYDTGGAEVAYHDSDAVNSPGRAYRTDGVDIASVAGAGNGHVVTSMYGSEWLEYTVQVPQSGLYTFNFRHSGPASSIRVEVNGVDATGTISLPGSVSSIYQTTSKTGVSLAAGTAVFRVYVVTGSPYLSVDWFEFIKQNDPPTVTLTKPPPAYTVFDTTDAIPLAATASDADGSIAKVEFYAGATKVGEDLTPTSGVYEYSWSGMSAGTYAITARAIDNVGGTTTSPAVSLRVTQPSTPFGGIARTLPGLVEAEDYDDGGAEIAYHVLADGSVSNNYRGGTDVDVYFCDPITEVACGYKVYDVEDYEWMRYTVDVREAGVYSVNVRVANLGGSSALRFEVDGIDVTGTVTIPASPNGQFFTLGTPSFKLTPGLHVIRFVPIYTNIELNWFEFVGVAGGYRGIEPTFPSDSPRIEAEHFDSGGEGYGYHDLTITNDGGAYRPGGADIAAGSTHSNGHRVESIQAGEWLRYSINMATAGAYRLVVRAGSPVTGSTLRVTANGTDVSGPIAVPNTGSASSFATLTIDNVNLPAGEVNLRLNGVAGNASADWLEIQPMAQQPYGGGAPAAIPGRIRAEHYDRGGEGVAYHDTDDVNVDGGGTRRDGVDLANCREYQCGAAVTGIAQGEWLEYSVNVETTDDYELRARVSSDPVNDFNRTFEILVDGQPVISANSTQVMRGDSYSVDHWRNEIVSRVALTAGAHVIRYHALSGQHRLHWIEFVPVPVAGAFDVRVTSPVPGDTKPPPATFQISAAASDSDLSDTASAPPTKMELYVGAGSSPVTGCSMTAQFTLTCSVTSLPLGTYTATVVATREENDVLVYRKQSDGVVLVVENGPPTLTLTLVPSPEGDPPALYDPASIGWTLSRNDPDNRIKHVYVIRHRYHPGSILYLQTYRTPSPVEWPLAGGTDTVQWGLHKYCAYGLDVNRRIIAISNCPTAEVLQDYWVEVTSVTPSTLPVGATLTMQATVHYLNPPSNEDDWVDEVYFYVHPNPDAEGSNIARVTMTPNTFTGAASWTIPAFNSDLSFTPGPYYVRARGYRANSAVESASALSNAVSFEITGPRPVLTASPQFGLSPGGQTELRVDPIGVQSATSATFFRSDNPGMAGATPIGDAVTTQPYTRLWTNIPAGTTWVRATVVDGAGASHDSNVLAISTTSAGDVDGDAPVSLDSELGTHDPTVGAIAGTPGVSGGAATYDIPIVVPPGRRGMEPKLALSYNSRNGNGIAGMGWSLSGLSSIHRCPRTLAQDGEVRPVEFTNDDRLCLDGQRLMRVSGGAYGVTGAVYRTEIDSFVKVTQLGGDLASGSSYFKAQTKSGETLWFGAADGAATVNGRVVPTPAAAVTNASAPLSWLLVLREDPLRNAVRYDYATSDQYGTYGSGEYLIRSIEYTLHNGAVVNPTRRVEFDYGNAQRSDPTSSYLARRLMAQTRLLAGVTTKVGDESVRRYSLTYIESQTTRRRLLDKVEECAARDPSGAAWDCLPATQIAWQHGPPRYKLKRLDLSQAIAQALLATLEPGAGALPPGDPADGNLRTEAEAPRVLARPGADFDGDGYREVVIHRPRISETEPAVTVLATFGGDRELRQAIAIENSRTLETLLGIGAEYQADFNRDGRVDLVAAVNDQLQIHTWSSSPSCAPGAINPMASCFAQLALAGDVVDLSQAGGATIGTDFAHIGDLDSDGLADIVVRRGCVSTNCYTQLDVYMNVSTTTSTIAFSRVATLPLGNGSQNSSSEAQHLLRTSDIDGNGIADFLLSQKLPRSSGEQLLPAWVQFGQRGAVASWSPQSDFAALFDPSGPTSDDDHVGGRGFLEWTDVNADGLDDLLFPVESQVNGTTFRRWTIRLNLGGRFGPRITVAGEGPQTNLHPGLESCMTTNGGCYQGTQYTYQRMMRLWDYDGDGRAELLVPQSFASRVCTYHRPFLDPASPACDGNPEGPDGEPEIDPNAPILAAIGRYQDCEDFYYCPEPPPGSRTEVLNAQVRLRGDVSPRDGFIDTPLVPGCLNGGPLCGDEVSKMYASHGGGVDHSSYWMSAIRFRQTGPTSFEIDRVANSGIVATRNRLAAEDAFGDGLTDGLTAIGCAYRNLEECMVPVARADGIRYSEADVPTMLAGDPTLGPLSHGMFLIENLGHVPSPGSGRTTPELPDLVSKVTAGIGRTDVTSTWSYYPLSSNADRGAGTLPLYSVSSPADQTTGGANEDGESTRFTSSMPVVASFRTSNGVGGMNERRYGYRKAVYNNKGRGFLGFREIIEEDLASEPLVVSWTRPRA
jgi:hypothetical protein